MKFLLFGALLFVSFSLARAESPAQPEVWQDSETGAVVRMANIPRAEDAQSVREQVAGVLDSMLAQPIIPTEFGQTTINGLPAFYMRGVLLVEPEVQVILVFALFSETGTNVGTVTSEDDVDFSYVENHAKVSGVPHPAAAEVLKDIAKRSQAGLPELKKIARSKNRAVIEKFQLQVSKNNESVDVAKTKRDDLAPDESNAVALNQRLRALKPAKIYGWGAKHLSDTERTVTFIYEGGGKSVMLVWIVNSADQTTTNISTDTDRIETLRANRQLNLPSDKRLMSYNPEYDMTTFRNSDYYRGRGTDPLGRPIE